MQNRIISHTLGSFHDAIIDLLAGSCFSVHHELLLNYNYIHRNQKKKKKLISSRAFSAQPLSCPGRAAWKLRRVAPRSADMSDALAWRR